MKSTKRLQMSPCGVATRCNLLLRMLELEPLIMRAIASAVNTDRLAVWQAMFELKICLSLSSRLCKPLMRLIHLTTARLQRPARRHMSTSGLSPQRISEHWQLNCLPMRMKNYTYMLTCNLYPTHNHYRTQIITFKVYMPLLVVKCHSIIHSMPASCIADSNSLILDYQQLLSKLILAHIAYNYSTFQD